MNTSDPALACYNMALSVLRDGDEPAARPTITITRGSRVIQIPLEVRPLPTRDGLAHQSATGGITAVTSDEKQPHVRIAVEGDVASWNGALITAHFVEGEILIDGTPLASTACSVARISSFGAASST